MRTHKEAIPLGWLLFYILYTMFFSSPHRHYFDSAAQTPLLPHARDVLVSLVRAQEKGVYAHPDSPHRRGVAARDLIAKYKKDMARCISVSPSSILFFPNATSAHLFVTTMHTGNSSRSGKRHIILSANEHIKIHQTLQHCRNDVSTVVGAQGRQTTPQDIEDALTPETTLVSVVAVQSETGVVNDIRALYLTVQRYNKKHNTHILFHTDATQYGAIYSLESLKDVCDFFSFNASKVYGAEGIASLCISPHAPENVKRYITTHYHDFQPLPLVGAFSTALCDTQQNRKKIYAHIVLLKRLLLASLFDTDVRVCGIDIPVCEYKKKDYTHLETMYSPHILCLSFPRIHTEYLVSLLDKGGQCVSAKSACKTYTSSDEVLGLRVSFSRYNTKKSVEALACAIKKALPLASRLL